MCIARHLSCKTDDSGTSAGHQLLQRPWPGTAGAHPRSLCPALPAERPGCFSSALASRLPPSRPWCSGRAFSADLRSRLTMLMMLNLMLMLMLMLQSSNQTYHAR